MGAIDGFRTLLKIRKDRKIGPPGPKPRMGAKICLHDVRITIPAGLTDDLWHWLSELGFREVTVKHERRRYRDVRPSKASRLLDADADDRRAILKECIRESSARPAPASKIRSSKQSD